MIHLLLFPLLFSGGADLEDLAGRHEIAWTCDAGTARHSVRAGRTTLVFAPGLGHALVNGVPLRLSAPVAVEGGRVKLPLELAREIASNAPLRGAKPPPAPPGPAAVVPPPAPPAPRNRPLAGCTIAIDPGHGGMHTGGKGRTGLMEKDINLHVSLELQKTLESWGAKVVMTRVVDRHFDVDVDDDLNMRVDIVNRHAPDLFLSVHTNYVDNPGPRGFEVWVPKNARGVRDAESRRLARTVLSELGGVWQSEDRGVKDEHNLRVLKGTTCPAALVELEFVSNPAAERQLAQPAVRRRLADALADAVRRWFADRR